jgi:hypothetical protein
MPPLATPSTCGVCDTGIVFRADVKGRTLHFEYDRMVAANEVQKDVETGSSWQQASGKAIDGPLKGTRLIVKRARHGTRMGCASKGG